MAPPQRRPNPAKIADEQARVLDLRRLGFSVRQIADQTGLPKSTVQDRLDAAIQEMVAPVADEVRLLELERLDSWHIRLENRLARAPNEAEKIIPTLLKCQERRSKYLGLDAPERAEVAVASLAADDPQILDTLARARQASTAQIDALRGNQEPL